MIKDQITELSEILTTALADRPDLEKRLTGLLGSGVTAPELKGKGKTTRAQVRAKLIQTYNALHLREKIQQSRHDSN